MQSVGNEVVLVHCIEGYGYFMKYKIYLYENHHRKQDTTLAMKRQPNTIPKNIGCITVPLENLSGLLHSAETGHQCSGPVVLFVSEYQLQQSAGLALHICITMFT